MLHIDTEIAIVLIGFNRPHFIARRLNQLRMADLSNVDLWVSLDGPRPGNGRDRVNVKMCNQVIREFSPDLKIQVEVMHKNYGCDEHIPIAITNKLLSYKSVIIIEDDVSVPPKALKALIDKTKSNQSLGFLEPIVAMSGLAFPTWPWPKNLWRECMYFSAWGYALNRDFWALHTNLQAKRFADKELINFMDENKRWRELPKRKRRIWLERFNRGNYDYQIQKTMMIEKISSWAPLFRLSDNEGHLITEATHTRYGKPAYLRFFSNSDNGIISKNVTMPKWSSKFLRFVDSNTWAGDGFLSRRGRSLGFRTGINRLLQLFILRGNRA